MSIVRSETKISKRTFEANTDAVLEILRLVEKTGVIVHMGNTKYLVKSEEDTQEQSVGRRWIQVRFEENAIPPFCSSNITRRAYVRYDSVRRPQQCEDDGNGESNTHFATV